MTVVEKNVNTILFHRWQNPMVCEMAIEINQNDLVPLDMKCRAYELCMDIEKKSKALRDLWKEAMTNNDLEEQLNQHCAD